MLFRRLVGIRGRLRARGGRERVRRQRSSTCRRSPTCSRVWSRSRWSPPTKAHPASDATACSRPSASTRGERLVEAGETLAPEPSGTPSWALALAEASAHSPQLDRDAANLRVGPRHAARSRSGRIARVLRALLPVLDAPDRPRRGGRRFDEVLAAAPERTALRSQALLAAAAIDFRSGALARGFARAEESYDVACEIGDARAQWRALQFLGEVRLASDAADEARPWLERALELAHREAFPAAEATCVYSLGVVRWMLGDLDGAEQLLAESIELFSALAGSPERIPSPVNFAEIDSQAGARPGLRLVFEDTLQPFFEISCDAAVGYVLANQAGIARARGDLARARRAPRRERGPLRGAQRRPRAGRRCSSGARTSSSPEDALAPAREALAAGARAAARARRSPRPRAGARGARPDRHDRRRLRSCRAASGRSPRHLPPRRRSVGACQHPVADRRPRLRAWAASTTRRRALQEARSVLGPTRARAMDRAIRSRGSPKSRCSVATTRRPVRCSPMRASAMPLGTTRSASPTSMSALDDLAKDVLSAGKEAAAYNSPHLLTERKTDMSHDHRPGARGSNGSGAAGSHSRRDRHAEATAATRRPARSGTAHTTAAARRSSSAAPAPPT